jgi:hypothetical protein
MRPATTTGTLIRKTEPHQKLSSSAPPRIGPIALARVEDVRDDRQRHGHDRGAAEAHQRAGPDQLVGRLGVRRQQRRQSEDREADGQHALATEPVAEHAGGEEQAGEDQRVRVDGPLQLTLAGPQAVLRVGERFQRDVEHGVVEDHHQEADDEHTQDGPAPWVSGVDLRLH